MSDIDDLHVSPSQIATMTGFSAPTVRKYVTGFLTPAFKSGKFSFYLRSEVEEYIEKHGHILSLLSPKFRKDKGAEESQEAVVSEEV